MGSSSGSRCIPIFIRLTMSSLVVSLCQKNPVPECDLLTCPRSLLCFSGFPSRLVYLYSVLGVWEIMCSLAIEYEWTEALL